MWPQMSYVGLLDLSFWLIDITDWNWLFLWYYPVLIEDITSHSSLECKIVYIYLLCKENKRYKQSGPTNNMTDSTIVWSMSLFLKTGIQNNKEDLCSTQPYTWANQIKCHRILMLESKSIYCSCIRQTR